MPNASKPVSPEAVATEISRLSRLPLREVKAAWQAEFRRAPPKGLWRDLLLRTLAWRLELIKLLNSTAILTGLLPKRPITT
jgi:hypothetical protein